MRLPRVLILYGTTDGHTRRIAMAISDTLRAADLDVDLVNARAHFDPPPEDYDSVIVAASVRAGGYQRAVRRWVRRHATSLAGRPTAFVSVCLSILDPSEKTATQREVILQRFFEETNWQPSVTRTFAGALLYTRYNWIVRWMMRRIVAKAHGDTDTSRDYEYTDWKEVREFARQFGRRLRAPAPSAVAV